MWTDIYCTVRTDHDHICATHVQPVATILSDVVVIELWSTTCSCIWFVIWASILQLSTKWDVHVWQNCEICKISEVFNQTWKFLQLKLTFVQWMKKLIGHLVVSPHNHPDSSCKLEFFKHVLIDLTRFWSAFYHVYFYLNFVLSYTLSHIKMMYIFMI